MSLPRHVVVGVDPGLVHTGYVELEFYPDLKLVHTKWRILDGDASEEVKELIHTTVRQPEVFVEDYRPRSNFGTDSRMREQIGKYRALNPWVHLLDNTGVKKIITSQMMKLFDLWSFPERTHHDDLRSAARIALYGMAKDSLLNSVLTDAVTGLLDKNWTTSKEKIQ